MRKIIKKHGSHILKDEPLYGFESGTKWFEGCTLRTLLDIERSINISINKEAILADNFYVRDNMKILAAVREQFPEDLV